MLSLRFLCLGIIFYLSMVLALTSLASQNNKLIISTEEQIAQDTAQVPCKDSERLKSVKSQFLRLGAQPEDVLTDKRDGVDNIIVRKQGQAQGIIVIGAHYDKSESGCGAIDNWTGVVALTHIYRSLKLTFRLFAIQNEKSDKLGEWQTKLRI